MKMESTVLTPKQLAARWQISLAKVYEDNNAGKIPHLQDNKNRFPVAAIEEMEMEANFDKSNIKTPKERRLEREIASQTKLLAQKDNEIKKLKDIVAEMQLLASRALYIDGQAL